MGRSASTLPLSVLITINFWGLRHPMNRRCLVVSMVMPTGAPPGATGHSAMTFFAFMSKTATSFLSIRFTKTLSAPSEARNSGAPPRSMGASIFPFLGSMSGLIDISTPLSPVTDESAARLGNDRDAMGDLLTGDIGDGLAGFGVDHHGVRATRHVQPVRWRFDGEIVPPSLTANRKFLNDLPVRLRGQGRETREQEEAWDAEDPFDWHFRFFLWRLFKLRFSLFG